jgi:hypothetical protein
MSGDVHVRFCESAGVRLPRATLLVIGFTREDDARRVMEVLPKRFGKYGLTIHPEKTKLVPFRRPPYSSSPKGGPRGDRPGTFDLLGFYALLEPFQKMQLGDQAENGGEPIHPGGQDDCPLVPEEPASPDCRAAPNTQPEAARALRLLRDYGQQRCPEPIP